MHQSRQSPSGVVSVGCHGSWSAIPLAYVLVLSSASGVLGRQPRRSSADALRQLRMNDGGNPSMTPRRSSADACRAALRASRATAQAGPQSRTRWGVMRLLLAIAILITSGVAHAQYTRGYPLYPPGYPPYPPAYVPSPPGGAADRPPTQGYTTTQPGGDARSLARDTLAPQNAVRASVGDPPLRWSDRLADVAQDWAGHLLESEQFAHRQADPYGENLYEITGGTTSPQQVGTCQRL